MTANGHPGSYIAARVAAFVAAHRLVRLCADCAKAWARKIVNRVRVEEPGWCVVCGRRGTAAIAADAWLGRKTTSPSRRRRPRAA